ncbi:Uracil permease [Rhodotorula toruloides]|nr:Uracil permease [Rhodotorula toruloides]
MGLLKRLEVPAAEGAERALDNEDLRSTPIERRTWGKLFFGLFWFSAVTNVSNWLGGSSWLALGISYWEGLGCTTAGFFIVRTVVPFLLVLPSLRPDTFRRPSLVLTLQGDTQVSFWMVGCGRPGAKYGIPYPVICRSSFGVLGAGWPAFNRAVMATVWQAINSASGGQALYICLYAIFPTIRNIPNHMGTGSALTSAEMLCFFLYLLLNAAMLLLDVPKWAALVYSKVAVFCISSAGMLALAITKAGGSVGPVVSQPSTVHGPAKSWLLLQMILTSTASCSTFASNAADWQRNAKRPNDPILGQILGFPISNFIVQVVGMLVASTSASVYGEVVWNPVTYLKMLLEDNYDAKHRAGAFFIAAGFVYSLLFSCVFENIYCCGNDLASLFPKYISVKRGFWICLLGCAAFCPWYLLGTASRFITVLASYQIFLFSICGLIMSDYFLVSKGLFNYRDLYTLSKKGTYYYSYGFNWRAFAAYGVGVAINFAGFLNNLSIIHNHRLARSYWFSILTTTFAAGAVYYILVRLFPQPNYNAKWSEPKGVWVPPEADGAVLTDSAIDEAESTEKKDEIVGGVVPVLEHA